MRVICSIVLHIEAHKTLRKSPWLPPYLMSVRRMRDHVNIVAILFVGLRKLTGTSQRKGRSAPSVNWCDVRSSLNRTIRELDHFGQAADARA